ncbi:MAG: hypothetical protein AB1585_03100 [Thermodesulfobacteriota bacterium]
MESNKVELERLTLQAEAVFWETKYIQQRFVVLQTAAREIQEKVRALTQDQEKEGGNGKSESA